MSLIEKIDAEIEHHKACENSKSFGIKTFHKGAVQGLCVARQLILSEQKEPLTMGDKIRESNESLSAFIRGQFGDDRVFHDGKQIDLDEFLNQPSTK